MIEALIKQTIKDIRCIETYKIGKGYEERATLDHRRYGFVIELGRMLLAADNKDFSNTDHAMYAADAYLATH
jgi:hypothetical protein